MTQSWSPDSWRSKPIVQVPEFADATLLQPADRSASAMDEVAQSLLGDIGA